MDLSALIRLLETYPEKAASVILNLDKKGYYTEFTDLLNVCKLLNLDEEKISKKLDGIVGLMINNQEENKVQLSRKLIKQAIDELIDVLYEKTDKLIPRASFGGYVSLVVGKPDKELKEYEDLAFNYDGHKIEKEADRIYDSLNDIIHYLHDDMGIAANYSPEQLSFFKQTEEDITKKIEEGDLTGAKYTLVALQLYMDIGTKFRKELKDFILGPISLTQYLNIEIEKKMGGRGK